LCRFRQAPGLSSKRFHPHGRKRYQRFINNHPFLLGKTDFLAQNQVNLAPEHVSLVSTYQKQGATVICLSLSGQAIGILALADTIRTTAKATIASLAKLQVESILLTGDHLEVARQIAAQIGLKTIHADLLPEDKMSILQAYADKGLKLCMIGDGINDALALRTAYAGIAMAASAAISR
jgi:P-type E1-E2 ATPase